MITREQVADLRNQDVVRLTNPVLPDVVVEGKLFEVQGVLQLCSWMPVRRTDGEPAGNWYGWDLTVVSRAPRAPRPLYVNHPRTKPVPGDVVRDADKPGAEDPRVWMRCTFPAFGLWVNVGGRTVRDDEVLDLPARLRLLVDGTTGQVVPS